MNTARPVTDHDLEYFDSTLVAALAQRVVDTICAQRAISTVPWNQLPYAERSRVGYTVIAAVRSLNRQAEAVATWRAAEAVAIEQHGKPFAELSEADQRTCRLLSTTAIVAYNCHLKGLTESYAERRTLSLMQRIKARIAARNTEILAQPQAARHLTLVDRELAAQDAFGRATASTYINRAPAQE